MQRVGTGEMHGTLYIWSLVLWLLLRGCRLGPITLPPSLDNLVDDAELDRLLGSHKVIALKRLLEPIPRGGIVFVWARAVRGVNVGQSGADP